MAMWEPKFSSIADISHEFTKIGYEKKENIQHINDPFFPARHFHKRRYDRDLPAITRVDFIIEHICKKGASVYSLIRLVAFVLVMQ